MKIIKIKKFITMNQKIIILIIISLMGIKKIKSQSCLSGITIFSSQDQIDNFQNNYPNCEIIEGDVSIEGSGVSNLIGLNSIRKIEGTLVIRNTINIFNLEGLDSLKMIDGGLTIRQNNDLINFKGLDNLQFIGDDFRIEMNQSLQELNGIEGLENINGFFLIQENHNLQNLIGLDNLSSINNGFTILNNNLLINLAGLENLNLINGDFSILNNTSLNSIESLINLISIGDNRLTVSGNTILENLEGLNNINYESITNLIISLNPNLSICSIQSICDYLINNDQNVFYLIEENATNCNDDSEVLQFCQISNTTNIEEDFNNLKIFPNPSLGEIHFSSSTKKNVKIYNQLGVLILEKDSVFEFLDVRKLPSGIYYLEVKYNNAIKINLKFVKA